MQIPRGNFWTQKDRLEFSYWRRTIRTFISWRQLNVYILLEFSLLVATQRLGGVAKYCVCEEGTQRLRENAILLRSLATFLRAPRNSKIEFLMSSHEFLCTPNLPAEYDVFIRTSGVSEGGSGSLLFVTLIGSADSCPEVPIQGPMPRNS